jgi:hypothetical protein
MIVTNPATAKNPATPIGEKTKTVDSAPPKTPKISSKIQVKKERTPPINASKYLIVPI